VVLWRLQYQLALRGLPEMFLNRGIVFSHEALRDWETKLTPALAENEAFQNLGGEQPASVIWPWLPWPLRAFDTRR
jgi:hypothetical protein